MGGWYDADGFVPGLAFGQYISGIARFAATTNNAAAHAQVAALVDGFGAAIGTAKKPYSGTNPPAPWAAYVMGKYREALVAGFALSGGERNREMIPIALTQ